MIASKVARTMAGFAASGRGSVCTWQFRVCISASRCHRPVATDRPPYFLSRGDRTGSEFDPVESRLKLWRKRRPLFRTGGGLGILSRSRAGTDAARGTEEVEEEEEEEEKGLARGEKNTGVLLSTAGNSAQPPPTGTSDESIDLGVGLKTPLSPAPLTVGSLPRRCTTTALFLFRSPLVLHLFSPSPFRHYGHCAPHSFPAFFFSPRKWTKLKAAARPLCPTASYSWGASMRDDDIHAIYDFPVILKIPSYSSALREYFLSTE